MPSPAQISAAVDRYVTLVGTGTAKEIGALYDEAATLEDPVGGEVHIGRAAITAFYSVLDNVTTTAELITIRVSGDEAAFHMRVVTTRPDQIVTIEPIDVMAFNNDGLITSMRAYWGPADITTTARGH
ncbi:nuclear transport factor 2 family protein [Nocardia carnea]|uniref:nuclear transport factor 2 family protein n=1 Tax=Nocardia carnea TaxID=37328 RepID=UPI002453C371|nr:nuclear transport factor 2 family protein [Nocardia carnea]